MSNSLISSALRNTKSFKKTLTNIINTRDFPEKCLEFISWTIDNAYSKKTLPLINILISYLEQTKHEELKVLVNCGKFSCYVFEKEYLKLSAELSVILNTSIKNNCIEAGQEICELILYFMEYSTSLPSETKILFLREIVYFSYRINDYQNAVNISLKIASIFASHSAFQSAYRILSEAEEAAEEIGDLKLMAKIHAEGGLVSYLEKDFENAAKYFQSSVSLYNRDNSEIPLKLLNNLATSLMRIGQREDAIQIYNELIEKDIDYKLQQTIYLNLIVCYRELEDLEKVRYIYEKIDYTYFENENPDVAIEFHLISANTYYLLKEYTRSLKYLESAIKKIEEDLENIFRLHYRRGYRENYIKRIEKTFLNLLEKESFLEEEIGSILLVFTFLKMNASSDWMSLFNWISNINSLEYISQTDKQNLTQAYESLKNQGIPFLYYYHEKYDDPFEEYSSFPVTSKFWNDFNIIIKSIIEKHSLNSPFQDANALKISEKLLAKIKNNNYSFLFSNISNGQILITYLNSSGVKNIQLPIEPYIEFRRSILQYQQKYHSLNQFKGYLNDLVEAYKFTFEEIINLFETNSTIINAENKNLKLLPINALLMNSSTYRHLLKSSDFKLYSSPIIYEYKVFKKEIKKYIGIYEPFKELPLLEPEVKLSGNSIFDSITMLDIREGVDFTKVKDADFIHFASHGFPISSYTDPIFSKMSGPLSENSLSFAKIQNEFHNYDYQLILLSMCDSSDSLDRAFKKTYLTNELISFPLLFLLNQKSVVISFNWPIIDIVPYVFSYLFFKIYKIEKNLYKTFNQALLGLYELTAEELINILENIDDENIRNKKVNLFNSMEKSFRPFNHSYIFGAITLNSLITNP
ncbi:tetratricopeptide repeat protein [Lysinibacillus sp. JNUCC 51]|uniref:tetratricopeptide repeat protein n=1 Tax=Lysinibacillus sp. JNUCC-51 TaxID=2792479 RepID=UPI001938E51F|nr:hypothetical protein JNUCC51_15965 [Lysinibacillus sp. JNUCC-51]